MSPGARADHRLAIAHFDQCSAAQKDLIGAIGLAMVD